VNQGDAPIRVMVVYYSRFGAVERLAKCVAEGVERAENVVADLMKVEDQPIDELRPGEDQDAMLRRRAEVINRFIMADAIVVGSPGYFGDMAAAIHRLFEDCATGARASVIDRTRPWRHYLFKDKVGAAFAATGTPHGGIEATLLAILRMFMHFGMIPVTPGQQQPILEDESTPYGATTTTGPTGNRPPTEADEEQARRLGQRVAEVTTWLVIGAGEWAANRNAPQTTRGGENPL